MTIRETIEEMERQTLSPYATLNENSRGAPEAGTPV